MDRGDDLDPILLIAKDHFDPVFLRLRPPVVMMAVAGFAGAGDLQPAPFVEPDPLRIRNRQAFGAIETHQEDSTHQT